MSFRITRKHPVAARRRALAAVAAAVMLAGATAYGQASWTVLGWNNLGMHCADADFSVFCILPPYNTIQSQTINASGRLVGGDQGVTVTYQAVADPAGSINRSSIGKSDFWQYCEALFGVALPADTGLPVPGPYAYAMPGAANTPQGMEYDAWTNVFSAFGIPILPLDDAGQTNRYPMMRLTARSGGAAVATTDIVLPVSTEINCRACHGSDTDGAAQPFEGWVFDPNAERDFRLNILLLHDDKNADAPGYADALAAHGFNPAGL